MSLICVACNKIVVMSNNPDHYGCCAACGQKGLTQEQRKQIVDSGVSFRKSAADGKNTIPVALPYRE